MKLPADHTDRAAGALLGLAAGDALGAGYEFGTPPAGPAEMIGGGLGNWRQGEWTDDTQMAICVAEVTATGDVDLTAIGQRFLDWHASGPPDIGVQTRSVLSAASGPEDLASAAAEHFKRHTKGAAGNGSLMRTAPVALAHLGDDAAIVEAAVAVSALTHGDPLAGGACALWCVAIDRAVRQRRLDGIDDGLALLPEDRAEWWRQRIAEARSEAPGQFNPNGYVVTALQAALAAVTQTPVPEEQPARHFRDALDAGVRIGGDPDTVAAIAGSLLGARWGASAVPFRWRRMLHGWPGYRAADLVRLAVATAWKGGSDNSGWPLADDLSDHYRAEHSSERVAVALPHDPDVMGGNIAALADQDVDAVVSLCRVGAKQVPFHVEHHAVHLVDKIGANPNLTHVLLDTAEAIATLRTEGKRVYVHCAGGSSRTPHGPRGLPQRPVRPLRQGCVAGAAQRTGACAAQHRFLRLPASTTGETRPRSPQRRSSTEKR